MESAVPVIPEAVSSSGIRITSLFKTYAHGRVRALDGVDMMISHGETIGVIGPNGAGKTTLLGCMLGFLEPDHGSVTIDGLPPDAMQVRAATGYLPERLRFDQWMTGREFLSFHHGLSRMPRMDRVRDVTEMLVHVGLEAEAADSPLRRYSRGMLQRIGLAQALIGHPRYLFLDEPTSGMDPAGVLVFKKIVTDLKRLGVTIILNSHQIYQVERLCDRVLFMRSGRVESVDDRQASSASQRTLLVRVLPRGRKSRDPEAPWKRAAQLAKAELLEHGELEAAFAVPNDEAAARLLAALARERLAVIEAVPRESRLERLFGGTPEA